jgi:hypothetical protein
MGGKKSKKPKKVGTNQAGSTTAANLEQLNQVCKFGMMIDLVSEAT